MDTRSPSGPAAAGRGGRQKSPDRHGSAATANLTGASSRQQGNAMPPHASSNGSYKAVPGAPRMLGKGSAPDGVPGRTSKDSLKLKSRPDSPKVKSSSSKPHTEGNLANPNVEIIKGLRSELDGLKADFDSLRTLVTCKICDRLLYEPYVIACGHTYCYGCLSQWFVNNRNKKTCPDCRATVTQCPAPAYLIREMTQMFIQRISLLPLGESMEQHVQWQKEEAELVQHDKNNTDPRIGGMFKGLFNRRTEGLQPIRDEEDGVDRCPFCTFELEDGACSQCGLQFDDSGAATWPDSFGGFSDMDEASEVDLMAEEMAYDIDMDHGSSFYGDGTSEYGEDWLPDHLINNLDDDHAFAVSRWLAEGGLRFHGNQHRIPAAHSAAGGRRRSYSASILSERLTEDTEMDTLEEEDEEDVDDEDSSMNSFIDDDEPEGQAPPSSQPSRTPSITATARARRQRIVDSESSSNMSPATEEEDDEDDEGPVPHGRRRQQLASQSQAGPSRRRPVLPSESSADDYMDEEARSLLAESGWAPLDQDGVDDEMTEDGYESEGGRTAVGWGPITNSNDRLRNGGSLTPTADRPIPPIIPHSRAGNPRVLDGSRGLRRRSSILSTASAAHYEDGEADDDDSDAGGADGDGAHARSTPLRSRASRLRVRAMTPTQEGGRFINSVLGQGNPADNDDDDLSDNTRSRAGARQSVRQREYDPRISWIFQQHLTSMQNRPVPDLYGNLDQLAQLRTGTPFSRPRTANRNRQNNSASSGPPMSPAANGSYPPFPPPTPGPTRLRTPLDTSTGRATPSTPIRGENAATSNIPTSSVLLGTNNNGSPVRDVNVDFSPPRHQNIPGMASSAPARATSYPSAFSTVPSPILPPSTIDIIDRPTSRLGSRPPSATGRRISAPFPPPYQAFAMYPGLNFAARQFQAHQSRNPYFVRPRQSNQRLRVQPSNVPLRPSESRGALRPQPSQSNVRERNPNVRSQASRIHLRPVPSQQRLHNQSSTRTLRAGEAPASSQDLSSPPSNSETSSQGRSTTTWRPPLTEAERRARAAELVNRRRQELSSQEGRTNPFSAISHDQTTRRTAVSNVRNPSSYTSSSRLEGSEASGSMSGPSNSSSSSVVQQPSTSPADPNSTHHGVGGTIAQPGMARRRSYRNMAAPPGVFIPYANVGPNGIVRTRNGHQVNGVGYEVPPSTNMPRNVNTMVASDQQR